MPGNHRFLIHHGQEQCRLNRDQSIVDIPIAHKSWFYKTCSRLLFGIPAQYCGMFENIWVDEIANENQWHQFITPCKEEWKLCLFIVSPSHV